MSAADLAARAARRAALSRLTLWGVLVLIAVIAVVGVYRRGRTDGVRAEQARALTARLDTNARAITHATVVADTTHAIAERAVAQTDRQRITTRHADAAVTIVNDSTVDVTHEVTRQVTQDVAATADTLSTLETLRDTIPPLVVAELRADRAQITQDSITIRAQAADVQSLTALLTLKDQRITLLEQDVSALEARDAPRLGFTSGLLAGALAVLAVLHVTHAHL